MFVKIGNYTINVNNITYIEHDEKNKSVYVHFAYAKVALTELEAMSLYKHLPQARQVR